MSQITIRDLPEVLEREIRREAHRRGTSLNKTIIRILMKSLELDSPVDKKRDLSPLAGTWDEAAATEFEQTMSVFKTIDEENWRP